MGGLEEGVFSLKQGERKAGMQKLEAGEEA